MFESISVGGTKAAVLVLGHFQGQGLDRAARALDTGRVAAAALRRGEATGELGRMVEAFPKGRFRRVLIVGLGKEAKFTTEALRTAAAAVGRRLATTKEASAQFEVAGACGAAGIDPHRAGRAAGEALGLLGWVCDQFKGKGGEPPKRTALRVSSSSDEFEAGMERGLAVARSANLARTLSETPPNIATPGWMAEQARAMAKQAGLRCEVMQGERLVKERFEGLINVGKASENKPCMIRLEWPGEGKKAEPLVLIGKTMTYDTGGLSLKVNNGMVGMKRDKDGGCAVLAAMHAIATVVRPRRRVVALLAAAENSVSDEAYRPDDVLRYRNGVTVEVTNTDAEGRLVLADALCWACEVENPAAVIDLATLTGGVVTALGSTFAGMFCEDDGLRARVEAASADSGERVWRLPMHQEYRDMMKSPVADIVNSNPNRKAHPIQGAAFLSYFVRENIPWCHLDIAGVHASESDSGPFVKGPTGWGARLLASLVAAYE
ncbi:MAG: leucyl aminopeptidase family protein [Phycisphaerales bacterium]|nr:leucyl aminopeptidase family protein [Phycisphaerales bacterium]